MGGLGREAKWWDRGTPLSPFPYREPLVALLETWWESR